MAVEPRRIALSSPLRHGLPRFAVGGQGQAASGDVKVYEWVRERQEMRMIGIQTDLGQIRAMAWSPHPSYPSIFAVGSSTGRTTLHSLSSSTLSPSPNQPNVPLATLHIKHSRPITSLSFSPTDPNYIAAGLERHRSDHSLLVWDVADAIASSYPGVPPDGDTSYTRPGERIDVTNAHHTSRISEPRHLQAYCPSELVNSCAFLSGGYCLLASTNNRQIRLFDLRSSHSPTPPRDAVAAGAGAMLQYQTKAVHGITPHPLRGERFASFEPGQGQQGGIVRLWDTRRMGELLSLDLNEAVVGLQWHGNELGVGSRDGGVSLWEFLDGPGQIEDKDYMVVGGMKHVVRPKHHLHSFTFASDDRRGDVLFVGRDGVINIAPVISAPVIATSPQGDLALATSTSDIRILTPTAGPTGMARPGQIHPPYRSMPGDAFPDPAFLTARRTSDARVPLTPLAGPSRQRIPHEIPEAEDSDSEGDEAISGLSAWRAVSEDDIGVIMRKRAEEGYGLGDLSRNADVATRQAKPERLADMWDFVEHLTRYMSPTTSKSLNSSYDLTHHGIWGIWAGPSSALTFSPRSTHRPSAFSPPGSQQNQNSYLTAEAATREPIRQGSSAWASLKAQSPNSASTIAPVSGGFRPRTQSTTTRGGRSSSTATSTNDKSGMQLPPLDPEYLAAVGTMYQAKVAAGLMQGSGIKDNLPSGERTVLRRLILGLCAEEVFASGGDAGKDKMIPDAARPKAAAWAHFANDDERAVKVLLDSADPRHRLTGAALATSLIRAGSSRKPQREDWSTVMDGVEDPYIRAVLRRVGGDSWDVVLRESGKEGLDLLDRVVLAVNNLNDRELTEYLFSLRQSVLEDPKAPDPSTAIPILGLTGHLVPCLHAHLDQTADIQAVSLLASLIPPKSLSSAQRAKADRWTEAYRDVLDSWKMFDRRVEFDVKRQEIARDLGAIASSPSKGNCPVCNHVLSRQELDHAQRKVALKGTTTWPNERTYTCTFCANALPRCVICLTHIESRFKAGHSLDDDFLPTGPDLFDTLDTAYIACQTCRHGGHAGHILLWFEGGLDGQPGHDVCPVAGCDCQCAGL